MRLPPLRKAVIRRRLNRFSALVETEEGERVAHVPNSGRLQELLVPGYMGYVAAAGHRAQAEVALPWPPSGGMTVEARRTPYDLVLVDAGGVLVSCDARLPPLLVAEALAWGRVSSLAGRLAVGREPALGEGRADLLLAGPEGATILETKSITLAEGGLGLFPDAPTERGARHVRALAGRVASGAGRAAVAFVVQRPDVEGVRPYDAVDPVFGRALREAAETGVELLAFRCEVTEETVRIGEAVPVWL